MAYGQKALSCDPLNFQKFIREGSLSERHVDLPILTGDLKNKRFFF